MRSVCFDIMFKIVTIAADKPVCSLFDFLRSRCPGFRLYYAMVCMRLSGIVLVYDNIEIGSKPSGTVDRGTALEAVL